jgi:hypothetical protein
VSAHVALIVKQVAKSSSLSAFTADRLGVIHMYMHHADCPLAREHSLACLFGRRIGHGTVLLRS